MGGLELGKLKRNLGKASVRIYIIGVLIFVFCVVFIGTFFALNLSFWSVADQYKSSVKRNLQRVVYEFDSLDGRIQLNNTEVQSPDIFGIPVFRIPLEYINIAPGHTEDIKPLYGCSYASATTPNNRICAGMLVNKALGAIAYVRGGFEKEGDLSSPSYIDDPRTGDYFLVSLVVRGSTKKFLITFDPIKRAGNTQASYLSPAWSLTGFEIGSSTGRAYSLEKLIKGRALKVSSKEGADRFEFIFQVPVSPYARDAISANQSSEEVDIWPPVDLADARVDVKLISKEINGEGEIILDSSLSEPGTMFSFEKMGNYLAPGEILEFSAGLSNRNVEVKHSETVNTATARVFPFGAIDRMTDFVIRLIVPEVKINEVASLPGGERVTIRGDASSVLGGWRAAAQSIIMLSFILMVVLLVAYVVLRIFVLTPLYRVRRNTLHMKERFNIGNQYTLPFVIKESQSEVGVLWQNIMDLHEALLAYSRNAIERTKAEHQFLRALGHEIRSPLQDLLLRHKEESDPSTRYVRRISYAVQNLYGTTLGQDAGENLIFKTPQEAMSSLSGNITKENVTEYLVNSTESTVDSIIYLGLASPLYVMVDADMLESVLTAIINNANDFRVAGSNIVLGATLAEDDVVITIANQGPCILNESIDEIFEYGVSARSGEDGHLGQGLYMAKTYVSRMNGSLTAVNTESGVRFEIKFPWVA
ncbi:HAMP domain-containing histidine kinase [Pseudomonas moorei]|nr:HAMP domain-containing histidine kinase [Pseudomonas moorei]